MAIDTRYKRGSVLGFLVPSLVPLAQPSTAGVNQGERQAITWVYSGLLAEDVSDWIPGVFRRWDGTTWVEIRFRPRSDITALFEGIRTTSRLVTDDYNIAEDDTTIEVDASSNSVQVTLPLAVRKSGREYTVTILDITYPVTLIPSGTDTLPDGTSSFSFGKIGEALSLRGRSTEDGWIAI